MVWWGLGAKNHMAGISKIICLKIPVMLPDVERLRVHDPCFCHHEYGWKLSEVFFEISSGITLANVEMQSRNVVTKLTAYLLVASTPSSLHDSNFMNMKGEYDMTRIAQV